MLVLSPVSVTVVLKNVLIGQIHEQRDDIHHDVDVVVPQEADDGRDDVERDEIGVEVGPAGKDLELLDLVMDLGVGSELLDLVIMDFIVDLEVIGEPLNLELLDLVVNLRVVSELLDLENFSGLSGYFM